MAAEASRRERSSDVNAVNREGDTGLFGAANTGAITTAQFLVDTGAKVNVKNTRGETPLMITAGKGPACFARWVLTNRGRRVR